MTTLREAAQQALEALDTLQRAYREAVGLHNSSHDDSYTVKAHNAGAGLRAALAEPDDDSLTAAYMLGRYDAKKAEPQEPVGTYEEVMQTMRSLQTGTLEQQQAFALLKDKPLYAAPQPRKRLTREEIMDAVCDVDLDWHQGWTLDEDAPNRYETLCRAIEAAVWGEQP